MILARDILEKIILQKGYKSLYQFAKKEDINFKSFLNAIHQNAFTQKMIDKLNKILDCDLSFLVNAE